MKICIVTSSFPRYEGDYAGYFIYEQAMGLAQKHEVHVIYPTDHETTPGGDTLYRHPLPYPFRTYPLAQVRGLDLANTFRLLYSMRREIRRVKREHDIDLFYSFWTIPSAFVCALTCGGTPFLAGLMGSDVTVFGRNGMARPFISYAIRRANGIIALSNDLRNEAVKLGAEASRISVVPSGVDITRYRPMPKKDLRAGLRLPDGVLVLYVGSLFKLKRVDGIIRASARLRPRDFHLVIVGDGPERESLENLADSTGAKNIIFAGKVAHHDVPLYMAASDILVLFSETEGLPSCVQEAMASGLPVVASNVGGLPDLVADGVTGYLVDSENELASALDRLISSPSMTAGLGMNALNFARRNLCVDSVVERIGALCESRTNGHARLCDFPVSQESQKG
ncbi:MAG: glycosyltransferase [Chloroflexi bacterium]|nr:glycosyltransferase [Chloroflexota bacterium]